MRDKRFFLLIVLLWFIQADTYVPVSFDARYSLMEDQIQIEAGAQAVFDPYVYLLKNRHALSEQEQAKFPVNEAVDPKTPGDYVVQYGKSFTLQVHVKDTTAPVFQLSSLSLKQNEVYTWNEEQYNKIIDELSDNTTSEEELREHVACDDIDTSIAGMQEITCHVSDHYDNKTTSILTVSITAPNSIATSVASQYDNTPAPIPAASYSGEELAQIHQIAALVNEIRAANGRSPLTLDLGSYHDVTYIRTQEVLTSYSHTRPNGQPCYTIFGEYGLGYNSSGENIAQGQQSAQEVVNDWMNSPSHQENILRAEFTKISIGVLGEGASKIWVQEFFS